MIIKEENNYYLVNLPEMKKESKLRVGWIPIGSIGLVPETQRNDEQLWLFKSALRGSFSLNEEFILYLMKEGHKCINAIYIWKGKKGFIKNIPLTLFLDGIKTKNPVYPYDFQYGLAQKNITIYGDTIAKEIHKEIWDNYNSNQKQKDELRGNK